MKKLLYVFVPLLLVGCGNPNLKQSDTHVSVKTQNSNQKKIGVASYTIVVKSSVIHPNPVEFVKLDLDENFANVNDIILFSNRTMYSVPPDKILVETK